MKKQWISALICAGTLGLMTSVAHADGDQMTVSPKGYGNKQCHEACDCQCQKCSNCSSCECNGQKQCDCKTCTKN